MGYHINAGTPVKVARPGGTAQDHVTQYDQRFTDDELIADAFNPPDDDSAATQWARMGYYVFKRGDWYLIVDRSHVDIVY